MTIEDWAALGTAVLVVLGIALTAVGMLTAQEFPKLVTWGLLGLGVLLCIGGLVWGVVDTGDARDPRG